MPIDDSVLNAGEEGTIAHKLIKQEFRLLAEYKMIQSEHIGGCYVIPSNHSSLLWNGVMFVRKGLLKNGIFRFNISCENFPSDKTPVVIFQPDQIFHPLVNEYTGVMNLSAQFESWESENHIWQLLKYVKFLLEDIMHCSQLIENIENQNAADMYNKNYEEFAEKAKMCVNMSLEKIYENDTSIVDKHYLWFYPLQEEIHNTVLQNIQKTNSNLDFGVVNRKD